MHSLEDLIARSVQAFETTFQAEIERVIWTWSQSQSLVHLYITSSMNGKYRKTTRTIICVALLSVLCLNFVVKTHLYITILSVSFASRPRGVHRKFQFHLWPLDLQSIRNFLLIHRNDNPISRSIAAQLLAMGNGRPKTHPAGMPLFETRLDATQSDVCSRNTDSSW